MKLHLATALLIAGLAPAAAQIPPYSGVFPSNNGTGQNVGGVNAPAWYGNTQTDGYGPHTLRAMVASGTSQLTSPVIPASKVVITSCPAGAGVVLPPVESAQDIMVINRSGAGCLVYPSINGTAPGNATNPATPAGPAGATNAPLPIPPGDSVIQGKPPTILPGATPNGMVETAPGTLGAPGAPATVATNTDVTFKMVAPAIWYQ